MSHRTICSKQTSLQLLNVNYNFKPSHRNGGPIIIYDIFFKDYLLQEGLNDKFRQFVLRIATD